MKINIKDWESNHFGFIIADLSTSLEDYNYKEIESIINSKKIKLLQVNVGLSDVDFIQKLESDGFIFADVRCEYSACFNDFRMNTAEIIIASESDISELIAIIKTSLKYSRYFNTFFDKEKADLFYQIWIEKTLSAQFDDLCLIHRECDKITGFITLKKTEKNIGRIGLIAVTNQNQKLGVGSKLLMQSSAWMKKNNIRELSVVTQGANVSAQRFYQKNGFKSISTSCWLYKQFNI